jgi:hypothetical protein
MAKQREFSHGPNIAPSGKQVAPPEIRGKREAAQRAKKLAGSRKGATVNGR